MTAQIIMNEGQRVLVDSGALGVVQAVEHYNRNLAKDNCFNLLNLNKDRVTHFKRRVSELGKDPNEVVIVLLDVDDLHGGPLADALMPGFDWQLIRDRGEIPIARGLAGREGLQKVVDLIDPQVGAVLSELQGVAVVTMTSGTVIVSEA